MAIELTVPSVGESITEVEIGAWLKKPGDAVKKDEAIVEIESEKATVEVFAPEAGVIGEILKKTGESANIGDVIGYLEKDGAAAKKSDQDEEAESADDKKKSDEKEKDKKSIPEKKSEQAEESESAEGKEKSDEKEKDTSAGAGYIEADSGEESKPEKKDSEKSVMPAAKRAAAEAGVDTDAVEGTGKGGRVLKEDVQRAASGESKPEEKSAAPPASGDRQEETVRMTPMRRTIASQLVEAQQTAALLTTFNEADLSAIMALRNEYKDVFEKKYGIRLGFMSFFVKAAIEALKAFPAVNAEVRGENIVYKNYYDIGIAVSGKKGLVVPVMRNVERMSFHEIEAAIADMGKRAQENKITIEELQGGTFTITNGGIFGSLMSTPIINPPQSGILGMHAIQERPVVRDGEIVARPMMYLALTYDHRIVDGREAVSFLVRIKECVENPSRILLEV